MLLKLRFLTSICQGYLHAADAFIQLRQDTTVQSRVKSFVHTKVTQPQTN